MNTNEREPPLQRKNQDKRPHVEKDYVACKIVLSVDNVHSEKVATCQNLTSLDQTKNDLSIIDILFHRTRSSCHTGTVCRLGRRPICSNLI
jgi:hypothetical protein